MSEISDLPLAVYARRQPGATITAEIEGATDGQPALVVRFRVPGPVETAQIEARTRDAMLGLIQGAGGLTRYGLAGGGALDANETASLATFVSAVESAGVLVTDWNLAIAVDGGKPVKQDVNVEAIAELFRGRPNARAGWVLQYDTASPLERAEGNGTAASPDTTSATAANIAEGAQRPGAAAAGAASGGPGSSAPAP